MPEPTPTPSEDEVLTTHAGLIRSFAAKFAAPHEALDDLEQEGRIALVMAHRSYRPVIHGAKFSTYAAVLIRHAMIDHCARESRRPCRASDATLATIPCHASNDDDGSDFWEAFQAVLACLTVTERHVFAAWAGGMKLPTVCSIFGVTRHHATKALRRGLTLLGPHLTDHPPAVAKIDRRCLAAVS